MDGARSLTSFRLQAAGPRKTDRTNSKVSGSKAPSRSSLRKLQKVKLQEELSLREASTEGTKEILISRLLSLWAKHKEAPVQDAAPLQVIAVEDSRIAGLSGDLSKADEQYGALQDCVSLAEAQCSDQRQHLHELSTQLTNLRTAISAQKAQLHQAAQASAQRQEDTAWVKQMSSEIKALRERVGSLLRELLERDGVVAALRVQVRQRQQQLEAEGMESRELVAVNSLKAHGNARTSADVAPRSYWNESHDSSSELMRPVSSDAAGLEALWAISPDQDRLSTAQDQVFVESRNSSTAARSMRERSRAVNAPGHLLTSAALSFDNFLGSFMSRDECSSFYLASAGLLGGAMLAAAFLS